MLARIEAPHFTAGIVLIDDIVKETAPIVKYMRNWSRASVRNYCDQKGWKISVVQQFQQKEG